MSEIKTVDERLNGIDFSGNRVEVSTEEFVALNDEASELRAAYEALQKERDLLQAKVECLEGQNNLTQLKCHGEEETVKRIAAHSEVLQKEVTHWKANHADLKERLHVATHRTDLPSDRLPLFDKMKAEIAAQAKRIEELETATDHLGLTPQQASDGLARYKAQVAEIESLRKQVEELLGASRMAITALAHTSQKNELYDEAYKRLDSAISFISASKNGE